MTADYLIGTILAAFFASLAAVLVTWRIQRSTERRDAKAEMLRAIARHADRLWTYAAAHSAARIAGISNMTTFNGEMAPAKPPMSGLLSEIDSAGGFLTTKAQPAVRKIVDALGDAEVANEERRELADWQAEAAGIRDVAKRIAAWDGRASTL
jgi:hypothetical protein